MLLLICNCTTSQGSTSEIGFAWNLIQLCLLQQCTCRLARLQLRNKAHTLHIGKKLACVTLQLSPINDSRKGIQRALLRLLAPT